MEYPDGIYDGVVNDWIPPNEYHAMTDRVSRSQLLRLGESPASYVYHRDNPQDATAAMIGGDAGHAALLEPDRFAREYVMEPQWGHLCKTATTTAAEGKFNKERRGAWLARAETSGLTIVPSAEAGPLGEVLAKASTHAELQSVLRSGGKVESSALWTTRVRGVDIPQRCRTDLINFDDDGPLVLDLKFVQDSSPGPFWRDVTMWRHHIQAAMYMEGMSVATGVEHRRFGWIVLSKNPPYDFALYMLDEESLEIGTIEYHGLLDEFARCTESGEWGDNFSKPQGGGLTSWYRRQFKLKREGRTYSY